MLIATGGKFYGIKIVIILKSIESYQIKNQQNKGFETFPLFFSYFFLFFLAFTFILFLLLHKILF